MPERVNVEKRGKQVRKAREKKTKTPKTKEIRQMGSTAPMSRHLPSRPTPSVASPRVNSDVKHAVFDSRVKVHVVPSTRVDPLAVKGIVAAVTGDVVLSQIRPRAGTGAVGQTCRRVDRD